MKRLTFFCTVLATLSVAKPSHAQDAQAPSTASNHKYFLSYQGVLDDNGLNPVSDNTYRFHVSLYTRPDGMEKIWEDDYTVPVERGMYHLLLGSGSKALPVASELDRPLWMGVSIDGGTELQPFSQLTGSPFAFNVPDASITTAKIADGAVTSDQLGVDYVGSIAVNGTTITSHGEGINFEGSGLAYDPGTNTILVHGTNAGITSKGDATQSETTIDGDLIVNGNTDLGGNAADPTIKFTGKASSDLDMNGYSVKNANSVTIQPAGSTTIATVQAAPHAVSRTYSIPDAGANANFVMSEGPQTVNGSLTMTSPLHVQNTDLTVDGTGTFGNGINVTGGSVALPVGTIDNSALVYPSVTINPGAGISGGGQVTLGQAITLTNTGVVGLYGTANQVMASTADDGTITLSTPQDIGTTSSPTFSSLAVGLKITSASTVSSDASSTVTTKDYVDQSNVLTKACAVADAKIYTDNALGTVTARSVTAGTGLSGGGDLTASRTISLANTSVTPGTYTNPSITVDQQGRITAASGLSVLQGSTLQTTGGSNNFAGSVSLTNSGGPTQTLTSTVSNSAVTVNSIVMTTVQGTSSTPGGTTYNVIIPNGSVTTGQFQVSVQRRDGTLIGSSEGVRLNYMVVN